MRKFTKLEKEIITKLTSSKMLKDQGVLRLGVLLEEFYVGPSHELSVFVLKSDEAIISYPKSHQAKTAPLLLIVTILRLLQYLESTGMISWVDQSGESPVGKGLGEQYKEGHNVRLTKELSLYVSETFNSIFTVSQDLIELVNAKFKEPEEVRHNQTIGIATAAVIISLFLGLWGIYKDLIKPDVSCKCSSNKPSPSTNTFTNINTEQNQILDPTWTTPVLKAKSDSQAGQD